MECIDNKTKRFLQKSASANTALVNLQRTFDTTNSFLFPISQNPSQRSG